MRKNAIKVGMQILALLLLSGCGCGRVEGNDMPNMEFVATESAENPENSEPVSETEPTEEMTEEQPPEETVESEVENEIESDDDGGGNEFSAQGEEMTDGNCISILVSENKYYYNNTVVTLEDIVVLINDAGEDVYVEIMDEEAAHREYSALIEKMEELEVSYVEIIECN